jgi:uncharacterized protein YggE
MKHVSTLVNAILALVLILILLTTGFPNFSARAAGPDDSAPTATATVEPTEEPKTSCDPNRNIHVSGTAVVNVLPDRALIQLGVQSNGRTPKEVQARNAAAISKVITAVKALGVEAKDISTDRYIIEPIYIPYDSLNIDGYRIYNIVSITMRDVDQASDAIAAAFQAGANQVVNVEFYTSELRKYRDQAREMAMKAASEKADALSKAAGADTSCVLTINENSWSYFNGHNWWYGANNQNLWTQNAVQNAAPSGGEAPSSDDSPVSAGHISIRAEVSVTFGLK